MMKKGQAAMEFLMTYGWAILVVLIAIGALALSGVFNIPTPDKNIFPSPFTALDTGSFTGSTGAIEIALTNGLGNSMTLPLTGAGTDACASATITATLKNGTAITNSTVIPSGDVFLVTWTCGAQTVGDSFSTDLSFDYVNTKTGQSKVHKGAVSGSWK